MQIYFSSIANKSTADLTAKRGGGEKKEKSAMEEFFNMYGCLFVAMLAAFAVALVKAYVLEIGYQWRKRKALKNRTEERWIYKL